MRFQGSILLGFAMILVAPLIAEPTKQPLKKGGSATSQPARKKAKQSSKQYAAGPPYQSVRDMSPAAKREMSSRRYHLFRLKKRVQNALQCSACKGKGIRSRRAVVHDSGGTVSDIEMRGVCSRCRGLRILPNAQSHEALSEYYHQERAFRRDYLFAADMDTGLFRWIAASINTAEALGALNEFAFARIERGRRKTGDIFLVGVEVFSTEPMSDFWLLQAWLDPVCIETTREKSNLMIAFYDDCKQTAMQNYFMVVSYDGPVEYENFFGETKTADLLTCLGWKAIRVPVEP